MFIDLTIPSLATATEMILGSATAGQRDVAKARSGGDFALTEERVR